VPTEKANAMVEVPVSDARPEGASLSYFPGLDGVRGVAVVVIMGYHGGVFLTRGGFYSLDTFFALSGFLITSLLIAEWRTTRTVRLRTFWARRARRLLPGLLVLLLGLALYNAYLVPAGMYPHLRSDALSALFYFANWHFIAAGSNYFNQTGTTSPLLHTWSLAVEEQFYLVWPLVVLGTLKVFRSLRALLAVCCIGVIASACEMGLLYSPGNRNRVYYGTDTRAQSLLVGAALAVGLVLWAERRQRKGSLRSERRRLARQPAPLTAATPGGKRALLAVGLLGVVGSAVLWTLVTFNMSFAFQGGFLLAALATSAVLLSVVCAPDSALARLLSIRPLRYVGRISYGMYLWHFPLFQYVDHARTGLGPYPLFALRTVLTVVIASASFYLVERPIRRGTFLRGWKAWLATPLAVGATVVAVIAATVLPVSAATFTPPKKMDTGIYAGPPVRVLLVGDSTAYTLGLGLSAYEKDYDVDLHDAGILGCGVTQGTEYELQGVDAPMESACSGSTGTEQWPQIWQGDVASFRPNVVMILAGRWEVSNRTYKGHWTNILHPTYAAYVKSQVRRAVHVAGSKGAHVVLLTAPCYDTGEQPNGQPWPEDSPARLARYNAIVRQVAATTPNTSLINFDEMACPGGRYESHIDGVDARYDGVHFTLGGGVVFESRLFPTVVKLGRTRTAGST
jgi:peptidoglycan/LPS O-acetylase OafA/YrhL